ncbi:hypothetical protein BKA66DRAFT_568989 [Pyrenochaeta sp. MPI-SDFR-AT-0127]|nr:hypothetical protein BKA66DRAFT_568989 [Pyrenochaeta sp. MPI-SDFR-AT-0127]
MRLLIWFLASAIGILGAPVDGGISQGLTIEIPSITNFDSDLPSLNGTSGNMASASRYSCGQYKFEDGWTQNFVSQVWAGRPRDELICHSMNYERTHSTKGGQAGRMIAAKVDPGCTCFLYGTPCDPVQGHAEAWQGWETWGTWAYTDKVFKGWWCREAY